MSFEEAIAARFQRQDAVRAATQFLPEEELERLGDMLDDLKEVSRAGPQTGR